MPNSTGFPWSFPANGADEGLTDADNPVWTAVEMVVIICTFSAHKSCRLSLNVPFGEHSEPSLIQIFVNGGIVTLVAFIFCFLCFLDDHFIDLSQNL